MKRLILMALSLFAGAAGAQTYDVVISMSGNGVDLTPNIANVFKGSFTYANGSLTNVDVVDPLGFGGVFNAGLYSNGMVQLSDVTGPTEELLLSFNVLKPLGERGRVPIDVGSVSLSNIFDYPSVCGGIPGLYAPYLTCSAKMWAAPRSAVSAPEIGMGSAASALALLLGSLAVVRGGRRVSHSRNGLNDGFVVL